MQTAAPEPTPPHIDSRKRSLIVWLVVVLVLGALLFAAGYFVFSLGKFFSADVVNCKTFRSEVASAEATFAPTFRAIQRKTTCIAGLDSPDSAKLTLVSDAEIFREPASLQQEAAGRLTAAGWQAQPGGSFTRGATAEGHQVTYTAAPLIVTANPAVIQFSFSTDRTAFTDFGNAGDYPADKPLSQEDLRHYSAVQYAPTYELPGHAVQQIRPVSLTETYISFKNMAARPSEHKAAELALVLKLTTPENAAEVCGGSIQPNDPVGRCELLGTTDSGRPVYVGRPTTDPPKRRYHDAYASFENITATLVNGYQHPQASPRPADYEILRLMDSIQPQRL